MNIDLPRLWLPACLLLFGLSGCGRAPAAAAPTSADPLAPSEEQSGEKGSLESSEPATLAEAEQLLERARADLDRLALNEPGAPPATAAGAAAPPAPAPAPAAEPARDKRAEKSAAADEAEASAPPAKKVSTCETACKAFSSLERASDAVCRLDADGGQRCQRARQIREDAARRVQSCGCTR
jgi:hypothetical protein